MENVLIPGHEFMELVKDLKEAATALHGKPKGFEKEFVGNEEFMQLMGISKRTSQTWRDDGVIAFSQIGGKIYYSMADIKKLMQDHRREQFNDSKNRKHL